MNAKYVISERRKPLFHRSIQYPVFYVPLQISESRDGQ